MGDGLDYERVQECEKKQAISLGRYQRNQDRDTDFCFNLMNLRRTHVENNVREGYKDMISLFKSLEYYM